MSSSSSDDKASCSASIPRCNTCEFDLVLGTSSSSRKAVLLEGGYRILEVIKPRIDEKAIGDRSSASRAPELVLLIANSKADDIMLQIETRHNCNSSSSSSSSNSSGMDSKRVVLTGDQVVCIDNDIMEKPLDKDEAKRFMRKYHLHPVRTVGSIVLTNVTSSKRVSGVDIVSITFSEIPEQVIDQIVADGEVMYCCGALMIEHELIRPYIKNIEGGGEDAIRGMSLDHVRRLLIDLMRS
jgi:septum formation protein